MSKENIINECWANWNLFNRHEEIEITCGASSAPILANKEQVPIPIDRMWVGKISTATK